MITELLSKLKASNGLTEETKGYDMLDIPSNMGNRDIWEFDSLGNVKGGYYNGWNIINLLEKEIINIDDVEYLHDSMCDINL